MRILWILKFSIYLGALANILTSARGRLLNVFIAINRPIVIGIAILLLFYYFYRFLLSNCVCQLIIKFMIMMMMMLCILFITYFSLFLLPFLLIVYFCMCVFFATIFVNKDVYCELPDKVGSFGYLQRTSGITVQILVSKSDCNWNSYSS